MGKCVVISVIVKSVNGRIAAAYNDDHFTSARGYSFNDNGFIASVNEDGVVGEIFHRNHSAVVPWESWIILCVALRLVIRFLGISESLTIVTKTSIGFGVRGCRG
jgi:hypothetical protein